MYAIQSIFDTNINHNSIYYLFIKCCDYYFMAYSMTQFCEIARIFIICQKVIAGYIKVYFENICIHCIQCIDL